MPLFRSMNQIFIPYSLTISTQQNKFFIDNLESTHYIKQSISYENWGLETIDFSLLNLTASKNNQHNLTLALLPIIAQPNLNNISISLIPNHEFNLDYINKIISSLKIVFKEHNVTYEVINHIIYIKAPWLKEFTTYSPIKALEYGMKDFLPNLQNESLKQFKKLQNDIQMELYLSNQELDKENYPNFMWPLSFNNLDNTINFIQVQESDFSYISQDKIFPSHDLHKEKYTCINDYIFNYINNNAGFIQNVEEFLYNTYFNAQNKRYFTYLLGGLKNILVVAPKTWQQNIFLPKSKILNLANVQKYIK